VVIALVLDLAIYSICRAVWRMVLRPLTGWDCWFESRCGHGCLFIVKCCVLSSRGLRLITRPEDSYRMWWVWVWSWSLDNGALTFQGLLRHGGKKITPLSKILYSTTHLAWVQPNWFRFNMRWISLRLSSTSSKLSWMSSEMVSFKWRHPVVLFFTI